MYRNLNTYDILYNVFKIRYLRHITVRMHFFRASTCTAIAFYIPPPFLLFSFLPVSSFFYFLPARGPPLENVTAAILSYAVSHLHLSRPLNRVSAT